MKNKTALYVFGFAVVVGLVMNGKSIAYRAALATKGAKYMPLFDAAEKQYKIPAGLLARVAYQESSFNPDAKSPVGAVGLMQIVPKYHPDVNALDPVEAIPYAALYLRQLFDQFGNWKLALAAYNWGPGNLKKHGFDKRPEETRNYVADISRDVLLV